MRSDGFCDDACETAECAYDKKADKAGIGDCIDPTVNPIDSAESTMVTADTPWMRSMDIKAQQTLVYTNSVPSGSVLQAELSVTSRRRKSVGGQV